MRTRCPRSGPPFEGTGRSRPLRRPLAYPAPPDGRRTPSAAPCSSSRRVISGILGAVFRTATRCSRSRCLPQAADAVGHRRTCAGGQAILRPRRHGIRPRLRGPGAGRESPTQAGGCRSRLARRSTGRTSRRRYGRRRSLRGTRSARLGGVRGGSRARDGGCGAGAASTHPRRHVRGSITALPFSDESFDAVVATGVLEFVVDDLDGAIRELARVLRRDGEAVVSFPNRRAPVNIWRGRVLCPLVRAAKRVLPADRPSPPRVPLVPFRRLLSGFERAGLVVDAIEPVGVRPLPASVGKRLERSRSGLAFALAVQLVVRARKVN